MFRHMFFLSFIVTLLAIIQGIHAVEYVVTNKARNTHGGGIKILCPNLYVPPYVPPPIISHMDTIF